MKSIQILIFLIFGIFSGIKSVYADGCYICGSGSSESCKHYCRYTGSDSFENRKKCEQAGCKVAGTASCPTAINYKVCTVWNSKKSIYKRLVYNDLKLKASINWLLMHF